MHNCRVANYVFHSWRDILGNNPPVKLHSIFLSLVASHSSIFHFISLLEELDMEVYFIQKSSECHFSEFIARCYAVGKIYMQLCDKVRVIVAWGKNCREESDKVFAIGYQVVKELVWF